MGIKLPQLPAKLKLKSGISLAQIRQNLTIQDHTGPYRNIENNDCPLSIKVSQSVSKKQAPLILCAEVEKVSGIGPKTFYKRKDPDMKKVAFCHTYYSI